MAVIGLPGRRSLNVEWLTAAEKSLNVVFSYSSSPTSWDLCLSMLERKAVDVDSLISHRVRIEEFRAVFEAARNGEVIKAVMVF